MSESDSEKAPFGKKNGLIVVVARGDSIAKWAAANGVARRTAFNWAKRPEIRVEVNALRRRFVDRAAGTLSRRCNWAASRIVKLAEKAKSEPVQLAAARAVLTQTIAVSEFGDFESRLNNVEEQYRERNAEDAASAV
jgi:hypothetical protein